MNYTITTPAGTFTGVLEHGEIAVFRSLAYGTAKRFERAVMKEPCDQDCTGGYKAPIQPNAPDFVELTNDELYMDIYVDIHCKEPRAVMAYIPVGGGVMSHNWNVNPQRFIMEHPDVMFVVLGARAGILAALNMTVFDDYENYKEKFKYSNNLTKTDFILALQWIQKNIAAFGGDPQNVTISGHSYGGVCTTSMFLIEEAKGLFQKAMPRSGYAIDSRMLMSWDESVYRAKKMIEMTGIKRIEDLLKLTDEEFLDLQDKMTRQLRHGIPDGDFPGVLSAPFTTTIDNVVVKDNFFDTLIYTAEHVPMMSGTTGGESDRSTKGKTKEEAYQVAVNNFYTKLDPARGGVNGEALRRAYIDSHNGDELEAYVDMNNDFSYRTFMCALAAMFNKKGSAYTWMYNYYRENPKGIRAVHGDMQLASFGQLSITPDDIGTAIRACMASFMKYGDPNVNNPVFAVSGSQDKDNPYKEHLQWRPFDLEHQYTFLMDNGGCHEVEGVRPEDIRTGIQYADYYDKIKAYLEK